MRVIGAIFAVMLLAAPVFAGENEENGQEACERKEQEKKQEDKKREEKKDEKKVEKKDPLEEKIKRLIKEQDKNGDGAIGETEAKGDIKAKFGELDGNDDNKVTPEEIREFLKKRAEEEQKRKQEKRPEPKKEELRKEEPRKEEPRKDPPRQDGDRPRKG